MGKKSLAFGITFLLLLTINLTGCNENGDSGKKQIQFDGIAGENQISIASWNLNIFGTTKADKPYLLSYYAEKLDEYDIFVIQEIRNKSGEAIEKLADQPVLKDEYRYNISVRAGTTPQTEEQYAVFYNNKVEYLGEKDYTSEQNNDFVRPPFRITFKADKWIFTLFTIHTKPDSKRENGGLTITEQEIGKLEELIVEYQSLQSEIYDIVIIGDLNADGDYYEPDEIGGRHFNSWNWVIPNGWDTTVNPNNNFTYDRIIISTNVDNNFEYAGVMSDVTSDQSDHYLVYACFNTNET